MWRVVPPGRTAEWTYTTCISRIRNKDLKARLQHLTGDIVAASNDFEAAVHAGKVHEYPTSGDVGAVTEDELVDVYDLRFVPEGSPGRVVYDEIKAAATNRRCPVCGHRQAETVDHYLPKRHYTKLVVAPLNLIPACSDCNHRKLDEVPSTPTKVPLHPYFDNIEDDQWLFSEVLHTAPATVQFYVVPPNQWDAILAERVQNHFDFFRLNRLYAAEAAQELTNIRYELTMVLDSNGPGAVSDHLAGRAASCRHAHVNSWQTAAYSAWASSQWFYEGGFLAYG